MDILSCIRLSRIKLHSVVEKIMTNLPLRSSLQTVVRFPQAVTKTEEGRQFVTANNCVPGRNFIFIASDVPSGNKQKRGRNFITFNIFTGK